MSKSIEPGKLMQESLTENIELKNKLKKIIKLTSIFLNTNEYTIFEYMINDQLLDELSISLPELPLHVKPKLMEVIDWLDNEWYSYKVTERLKILYSLKIF